MTQVVREAAVRPAAAESYPCLPARMRTAAAHLTELIARYRGICAKAANRSARQTGAGRQPRLELARRRDERSWLTAPSPEATNLRRQASSRYRVRLRGDAAVRHE